MRTLKTHLQITAALAAVLTLTACGKSAPEVVQADNGAFAFANTAGAEDALLPPLPEALPMTAQASGPVRVAPPAARLPRAAPLGYAEAPGDDYAWIDRAGLIGDTIGDAPPDYGFVYDDVEPWAWEDDGYVTYAEPIDDGFRYYYYEPHATEPFFVRDADYGYAYSNGRIAGFYDAQGRYYRPDSAGWRRDAASRYYARARAMREARQERRPVAAPQWAERRAYVAQARERLNTARERQTDWQRYAARRDAVESRERLADERAARVQASSRFDRWQQAGFRGEAPRFDRSRRDARAERASLERDTRQRQAQQQRAVAMRRAEAVRDARADQRQAAAQQRQQVALAERRERLQQQRERAGAPQQRVEQARERQQIALRERAARQQAQRARVTQRQQEQRARLTERRQAQQAQVERRQAVQRQREEARRDVSRAQVQRQQAQRVAQRERAQAVRQSRVEQRQQFRQTERPRRVERPREVRAPQVARTRQAQPQRPQTVRAAPRFERPQPARQVRAAQAQRPQGMRGQGQRHRQD